MYEHKEGYCDKCHRRKENCVCNVAIKEDCYDDEYLDPKYENSCEDQDDYSSCDDCGPKKDSCPPPPKKECCPPPPKKNCCPPPKKDCYSAPKKNYCYPKEPCKKTMIQKPYYGCPLIEENLGDLECFIPLIAIVAMLLCSGTFNEDNIQLLLLFALIYLIIM